MQSDTSRPLRAEWVAKRSADPVRTQMHYARKGLVTEEMLYVAKRESLSPELVRDGAGGFSFDPEFTPPVIYSLENRQTLVYLIEARPGNGPGLKPGQIVNVSLPGAGG